MEFTYPTTNSVNIIEDEHEVTRYHIDDCTANIDRFDDAYDIHAELFNESIHNHPVPDNNIDMQSHEPSILEGIYQLRDFILSAFSDGYYDVS